MTHSDNAEQVPCDGCGQRTPRRWLIGAHHCEHCTTIRHHVERLVDWTWDPGWHRNATDPLTALRDLHVARVAANQLIRQLDRHAHDSGATWDQIGNAVHLDPPDAAARYSH